MARTPPTAPSGQYRFGQLLTSDPNSELYLPDDVPIIYADGFAGTGLGPNVARLTLFRIAHIEATPSQPSREIRVISNNVVVPSISLIEVMINLLRVIKSDPDIRTKLTGNVDVLMTMLENISVRSE
jgi:hypothetical protein